GSPIYEGRATYYLGAPRQPEATFDSSHAAVLPVANGLVLLPSSPGTPEVVRRRLGEPVASYGRWDDAQGHAAVELYQPPPEAFRPATALPARFGDAVAFEGYELPRTVSPGTRVHALLSWRVLGPAAP